MAEIRHFPAICNGQSRAKTAIVTGIFRRNPPFFPLA
jgi:hypothetical protein